MSAMLCEMCAAVEYIYIYILKLYFIKYENRMAGKCVHGIYSWQAAQLYLQLYGRHRHIKWSVESLNAK